jgi:hypothetical protein
MDVVTTHPADAISGAQIAVANGWDCSRSGENKQQISMTNFHFSLQIN